MFSKYTVHGLY